MFESRYSHSWGFLLGDDMEPEINIVFDKKGKTTITQNGLEITMTIRQRLAFNNLIHGTIPVGHQIDNKIAILPNGWIVEGDNA